MNERLYRNSKRYFVLAIFLVMFVLGLIANVIALQKGELGVEMKFATFVLGAFLIGLITLYVMTQRVRVGSEMVSQESCLGRRRVPYQRIDRIDLERIITRRGPVDLMKIRYQGDKLVLTSAMEGFDEFSRDIVARCPHVPVQDSRRRT